MKLGGGGRFKKLKREIMSRGKSAKAAESIAAAAGRAKYGKKRFQRLSMTGK
jgi:hypothetical protein